MIELYCVGIHFRQNINFVPDLDDKGTTTGTPKKYMSGQAILKSAADHFGLRYKLAPIDLKVASIYPQRAHVQFLSYTPTVKNDPHPRVTLPTNLPGDVPSNFPFYGLPLSLTEVLAPLGEVSRVIQYTVGSTKPYDNPTPRPLKNTGVPVPSDPVGSFNHTGDQAFGDNGFLDNTQIRLRLLSIYCTS
jgi:hypothetical protein